MIVDEGVYLEHFGVKGMRWGVRKKEKKEPRPGSFRSLPKSDQKKIVGVIGGTTVIAGGGAIAAAVLRNKGHFNVDLEDSQEFIRLGRIFIRKFLR